MGYFFNFSSLYLATYIEFYMCFQISYLNFKAVLALPNMARSAQAHKSISFIWIVWSTLNVYLWVSPKEWSKLQQSPNLAKLVNQTASLTIDRLGQLWKNSLMSNDLPNLFLLLNHFQPYSLFLLYTPVKKGKLLIFEKKLRQMLTPQIMFVVICRQAFVISLIRTCGGRWLTSAT